MDSDDPLQSVLNRCRAEGKTIKPPEQEIDRKLYLDFKKVMTQNLGKWKTNKQHFEFEYDAELLLTKLQAGERPNFKQDWHFFPTPPEVVDKMCNIHIPSDEYILEPSAGKCDMVVEVEKFIQGDRTWDLIEMNPINRAEIQKRGWGERLIWDDFDTFPIPEEKDRYELSYANPPFFKILEHTVKICQCLGRAGCAVVVVPESFERNFEKHLERLEPYFEYVGFYEVDQGSFKSSGTGVNTKIGYWAYRREEVPSDFLPQKKAKKREPDRVEASGLPLFDLGKS